MKGQRARHWAIQKEWLRTLSPGDLPNAIRVNGQMHTDVSRYLTRLQKAVKAARGYEGNLDKEINQLQSAVIWKTQHRKEY